MKRLLWVAAAIGAVNGAVAAVVLHYTSRIDGEFGWYSYAPLTDVHFAGNPPRPDWWPSLFVLPMLVAVLTMTLIATAARLGWITRERS